MLSNAEELESSRAERLAALEAKERAAEERETGNRERTRGLGGRPPFITQIQKRILDGEPRMKVR